MTHTQSEVRSLPLAALQLSQTRAQIERRAHLDKAALAELADSIRSFGLVQPIVVRPNGAPNTYEIVAGERRYLAAQAAGLKEIPASIRKLTDEQVLELQLVENLQRQDLHELAEAEGYEALQKLGHPAEEIAAKVGKSISYVNKRIQLLALGEAARKAFYEGKINVTIALLIARIANQSVQEEVLKDITEPQFGDEPMTAREAADHIRRNYMLRLDEAGFSIVDPDLVPAAGACNVCPKNTACQRELFADVGKKAHCTDPVCFRAKREAHGKRLIAQAEAGGRQVIQGEAAKKITRYGLHSLQGGYHRLEQHDYSDPKYRTYREVLGKSGAEHIALLKVPETGEVIEVVHQSAVERVLEERGVKRRDDAKSYHEELKARERKVKLEREYRSELYKAIRPRLPEELGREELQLIAMSFFQQHHNDTQRQLLNLWGWEPKKDKYSAGITEAGLERIPHLNDAELIQFLYDCVYIVQLNISTWEIERAKKPELLLATAERVGVDAKAIRKEISAAHRAKAKKKASKKTGK